MSSSFGYFPADSWAGSFLRHLYRDMHWRVPESRELISEIRNEAQRLFDAEVDSLPDRQGRLILAMSALVLAAYVAVKQWDDPEDAYDRVRLAFLQTRVVPMKWWFRFWLWFHSDPVADLHKSSFAERSRKIYGKSMAFDEELTKDAAELQVTRCAYHDYFKRHGHPELTLIICAWDRNWMDLVNASSRRVRIERPATWSTGSEVCLFRFVRDTDKAGHESEDVVLATLESPQGPAAD